MSSQSEISCGSVKPQVSIHQPQPSPPSTGKEPVIHKSESYRVVVSGLRVLL